MARCPQKPQKYHYKVILLAPANMGGMANAKLMLGKALDKLNAHSPIPGFRFPREVTAEYETAHDADEVIKRLAADPSIALVISGSTDEEQIKKMAAACKGHKTQFCWARRYPEHEREAFSGRGENDSDEPRILGIASQDSLEEMLGRKIYGHECSRDILTDPLADEENTQNRVGALVATLAMGVMSAHDIKNPPRRM